MIVRLIAHTVVTGWGHMRDAGWVDYDWADSEPGPEWNGQEPAVDADCLAEFGGRLCYQSWSRPNERTATNEGYLAHILEVEHTSVLEHASASFYVAEVSRSLLMELRTHRHLSFSALSQRYVDETNAQFVLPPAIIELYRKIAEYDKGSADAIVLQLNDMTNTVLETYEKLTTLLTQHGYSRKKAREAARCVLPNATETKFLVTGNMWAWHHVLSKRTAEGADAEMQELAREILRQLKEIAPNSFQDM